MYHVYVLKSLERDRLCTGYTRSLENRIKEHNMGRVRSTKAYKPYKLLYSEKFENKTEARKREIFLKSGQGRKWLKEQLERCSSG